jgi:hypothetical protein
MPNNFDFSQLKDVKTIEVNPQGWVTPLHVEYGTSNEEYTGVYGAIPSYYWRVKGTKHTFVIPVIRIDFLSSGNYKKHFENALETFREDYVDWKEKGFSTEWSRDYQRQFSRLIII